MMRKGGGSWGSRAAGRVCKCSRPSRRAGLRYFQTSPGGVGQWQCYSNDAEGRGKLGQGCRVCKCTRPSRRAGLRYFQTSPGGVGQWQCYNNESEGRGKPGQGCGAAACGPGLSEESRMLPKSFEAVTMLRNDAEGRGQPGAGVWSR